MQSPTQLPTRGPRPEMSTARQSGEDLSKRRLGGWVRRFAVIEAILEFCRAENRLSDSLGPFVSIEQLPSLFVTQTKAHYLREEVDHDGVRNAGAMPRAYTGRADRACQRRCGGWYLSTRPRPDATGLATPSAPA
jgi:hypothetical protein